MRSADHHAEKNALVKYRFTNEDYDQQTAHLLTAAVAYRRDNEARTRTPCLHQLPWQITHN